MFSPAPALPFTAFLFRFQPAEPKSLKQRGRPLRSHTETSGRIPLRVCWQAVHVARASPDSVCERGGLERHAANRGRGLPGHKHGRTRCTHCFSPSHRIVSEVTAGSRGGVRNNAELLRTLYRASPKDNILQKLYSDTDTRHDLIAVCVCACARVRSRVCPHSHHHSKIQGTPIPRTPRVDLLQPHPPSSHLPKPRPSLSTLISRMSYSLGV